MIHFLCFYLLGDDFLYNKMHIFAYPASEGCGGSGYMGKGVLKAVSNVNDVIGPMIKGMDPTKQTEIDEVRRRTSPPFTPWDPWRAT